MYQKPLIYICLTGDLTTDYRVHKTALTLLDMGFEIICVSRTKPGFGQFKETRYGASVLLTLFKRGPLFYMEFNLRLFIFLLFHSSSMVLSIDLDTLPGCWAGTRLRRRKLVFDSHEYFPESPELQHRPFVKNIWIWLERFLVCRVDKGYTVCDSIAEIYHQKYHANFKVVRNLPLASRSEISDPVVTDRRFKLVYQGAVNLGRGIFETLRAMHLLEDVLLIIVGDGDEMAKVKKYIEENQLSDCVWMTGKVPFHELPAYTSSADLGLCLLENIGLNYYYSLPNRIFDFAIAGKPILASGFPEIRKVVEKYGTGMLIEDLEPGTIAGAIREMQTNRLLVEQMSQNARKAALELTWENESVILKDIFLNS